jgi:gliding motility-associated-like protein
VVPDIIAFIPNAFTPDKKGPEANETFRITSANASQFHIKIFNKWGQQVFESYNIHNSWDGTFMNKNCQMGVYVYTIVLVNDSGVTYKYEGTVNLIR